MRVFVRQLALALALTCAASPCAEASAHARQSDGGRADERLRVILARVGETVGRYHEGLFGLAFVEVLTVEELRKDMTPKKTREFVFDSVVLREPLSDREGDYYAEVFRRLKAVDGRAPKKGDAAERDVLRGYGDVLNFLQPAQQKLYEFALGGEETFAGRRSFRVELLLRPGEGEPQVEWEGNSFRVSTPTRWTFWADAETFDVLRIESHLDAPFEFESPRLVGLGRIRFGPTRRLKYLAQDYAVNFRRVQLKDPEETRLAPESIEWLRVIEGASHPRVRGRIQFSDYKRFRSDVKIIEEQGP